MITRIPYLLSCLAFASSAQGAHISRRGYTPQAESYIVHQFPNPTWVENIAIRQTGQLLVTLLSAPDLYLIDPIFASEHPNSTQGATLVHSFAPLSALIGITETEPDHFYVIASSSPDYAPGTFSVVSVDLSSYDSTKNPDIVTKEVAAFPNAGLLNGMATLDAFKGMVIIADSIDGVIYILDVNTGEFRILLQEPEMAVPAGGQLGVNGVKVLPIADTDKVFVYFDNTDASLLCRVPVSLLTLEKVGPVEILQSGYSADDFALDPAGGFVYMADGSTNSINRVPLAGGKVVTVLGGINDTLVEGPTSVAVGRGASNEFVKYITTDGGLLAPINGFTEGGRVVAMII